MKRKHLFELMDQAWWPTTFKTWETDYLSVANRILGLYRASVSRMGQILSRLGSTRLIDLCSGSGRHLGPILDQIKNERNTVLNVTLTDIAPRITAYTEARQSHPHIDFAATPVDACSVPPRLKGFRTIFAGFHHFDPNQASGILKDAFTAREGIAIFEHTQRSIPGVASMLFTPLLVWLLTPFIRPFSFARLFWTYAIPVIPLAIMWDGLVSALRTYTPDEMQSMLKPFQEHDYQWHIETYRAAGLIKTTLLTGYPSPCRIEPGTDSVREPARSTAGFVPSQALMNR